MHDLLKFHRLCGLAVSLDEGGSLAIRDDRVAKDAVVFSKRPIRIDEHVHVELMQSTHWLGGLRVGLTSRNPDTYADQTALPRHLYPCGEGVKDIWVRPLREARLKSGCCLTLYVTKSGQLQCHINGDQDEPLLTGLPVNRPLWLVLDLYGNTCSARFVKRGNLQ